MEILSDIGTIAQAVLAIIGGCKIISRYTPWKWDDKIFDKAEGIVKKITSILPNKKS